MSDSLWFFVLSLQVGGWHVPPAQTRLVQSLVARQLLPGAQGPQSVPPQSASVSV
jgi:hypothetical protein